jgi:hypothetical protein
MSGLCVDYYCAQSMPLLWSLSRTSAACSDGRMHRSTRLPMLLHMLGAEDLTRCFFFRRAETSVKSCGPGRSFPLSIAG